MKQLAETSVIVMGLFSLWIWIAFVGINAMASRPVGYVVGQLCIWDLGVFVVVALGGSVWTHRWTQERRALAILLTTTSYIGLFVTYVLLDTPPHKSGPKHMKCRLAIEFF